MSFPVISRAIRIFFSYARTVQQDKALLNRLKVHLSPARREGLIDYLYDRENATNSTGEESIEASISEADIIVVLMSPDYFNSTVCVEVEMQHALERKAKGTHLIPVLLHQTDWETSPLSPYEPLPADGKPVDRPLRADKENALLEVSNEIRRVAKELAGLASKHSSLETRSSLDTIPYGRTPIFTDRKDILTRLHNYFTSDQDCQQTRFQALNGLAGGGKTQIAVEYAHLYKCEYQVILWLSTTSRTILREEIMRWADALSFSNQDLADEEHLFSALKRWLLQHDKWLLILDNLRDFGLIHHFVPLQSSGHVLLTTLSQATGVQVHPVPVTEMTPEDSALFLLRRARIIKEQASRNEASKADYEQALSIVQKVGGLCLALDQAGAFIEEKVCNLAGYFELYREQGPKLLALRGRFAHAHPDSVKVTFSLAFEAVDKKSPDVLELLRLFAFLHSDSIPLEMITQGASALDGPLHALASDPVALYEASDLLLSFSLVQRRTDPALLSVHRVVQDILIEELMPKQRRKWAMRTVRLVNRVFPKAEFSNWPTCEKYFSQARRCAELITEYRLTQKEAAPLLLRLGSYCHQRAYYSEAENYLTTALQLYKQAIEPDQPAIAQTLNNLALLYYKQGKYQEAEERYQRALEIREQLYGLDHYIVAETLNNLALLYKDWGKYRQAEALYQRVLIIDEHTLGPHHPDTAVSLSNLALVYDEMGKHAQAELLYQRAFSIEERTLDADHPDMALSLNMQAMQYEEQGDYQKAEALYQHALAIQEQYLGTEHPDAAQTLINLADLYRVQEKYQDAEALYQRALTICKQKLGREHSETARVLNNLAYLFRHQERYAEAEVLYQRALTVYEQTLGPEHPDTANVLNNLGKLYHLMEKNELAESLLRRGLDIRESVLGPEHGDTGRSLYTLAELFIHQQLYEQAEPLYQRFLNISLQELGSEHPDVVLAREQHALLLKRVHEQRQFNSSPGGKLY